MVTTRTRKVYRAEKEQDEEGNTMIDRRNMSTSGHLIYLSPANPLMTNQGEWSKHKSGKRGVQTALWGRMI